MIQFLSYLVNGISLGSVYAIIALGYSMVYGIAKMLNFAHGDVIMIGAFICFSATQYLGVPALAGVLLSVAVCTVLGITIEGLTGTMHWSADGEVDKTPTAVVIKDGVYVGTK